MREQLWVVALTAGFLLGGCTSEDPLYCDKDEDCAAGERCNTLVHVCEQRTDAGGDGGHRDARLDGATSDGAASDGTVDSLGDLPPIDDGGLGATCSDGSQCGSGHCVNNVCCESACTGACETCSAQTQGKCTPRDAGFPCADPVCSGSTLETRTCDGTSTACPAPATTPCAPYTCDPAGKQCRTSCASHAECTSGVCELFDAAKLNTCQASGICYASSAAACPGLGTDAAPHCTIQACLDKASAVQYVAVEEGTYDENLTVKADVQILSRRTAGPLLLEGVPQANVTRATLRQQSGGYSITSPGHALALYGMKITLGATTSPSPLVHIQAQGVTSRIRACWLVGDAVTTPPAGFTFHGAQTVHVEDSAVESTSKGINTEVASVVLSGVSINGTKSAAIAHQGGTLTGRDLLLVNNTKDGVLTAGTTVDLDRLRIRGNDDDGLVLTGNSKGTVMNALIHGNSSRGIYLYNNAQPVYFVNVTLADNGGLEAECGSVGLFYNSIVWGSAVTEWSGSCSFEHSDLKNWAAGTGNLSTDPLFEGSGDDRYRIQLSSPCVDTGADSITGVVMGTKDLLGNPRQVNKLTTNTTDTDMGAYEVQ